MKTIEKTFDAITGETTVLERDMTSEEITAYNKAVSDAQAATAAAETKAAEKAALLTRLGITADEAKLLLG
jgi:hypothetical protein